MTVFSRFLYKDTQIMATNVENNWHINCLLIINVYAKADYIQRYIQIIGFGERDEK